jgi:hypothetical protein
MSRPFRIAQLSPNTVADIHRLWAVIDFAPSYQRQSDIWGSSKQQLFVDSLINGYDIPKLYFHDLSWRQKGPRKRYAIIDGKQRLDAIHAFIEGGLELSDEFEDVEQDVPDDAQRAAGLNYKGLSAKYPALKSRFDQAELPIVLVQTDDLEVIEEMFSRLNEAVPLNAPEKRNALGGPLPTQIRRLARESCFLSRLAFPNARYRHLDLATKFLYIEHKAGLADLKKRALDDFVRQFKSQRLASRAEELFRLSSISLKRMSSIFVESDPLLASVGMITIYYQLFRKASAQHWLAEIKRDALVKFEDERAQNRALVKEAQELALEGKPSRGTPINPVLSQFERYVQSPNDVTALTRRYQVLEHFIRKGKIPTT